MPRNFSKMVFFGPQLDGNSLTKRFFDSPELRHGNYCLLPAMPLLIMSNVHFYAFQVTENLSQYNWRFHVCFWFACTQLRFCIFRMLVHCRNCIIVIMNWYFMTLRLLLLFFFVHTLTRLKMCTIVCNVSAVLG